MKNKTDRQMDISAAGALAEPDVQEAPELEHKAMRGCGGNWPHLWMTEGSEYTPSGEAADPGEAAGPGEYAGLGKMPSLALSSSVLEGD